MNSGTLDVVVACSDLKKLKPDDHLCLKNLEGTLDHRASVWLRRIRETPPTTPAGQLYQGLHWKTAVTAVSHCRSAGWSVRLWIASAGYGLLQEFDVVSPYSATFAPGKADSVWRGRADGRRSNAIAWWWRQVARERFDDLSANGGSVILVAGSDYVAALTGGWEARSEDRHGLSILSTSSNHPAALRYTSDASGAFQCTLGALNATMFLALASHAHEHGFDRTEMQQWIDLNLGHARRTSKKRSSASDDEVVNHIANLRRSEPRLSRSGALRTLRSAGIACSQERFELLWNVTS